MVTTMTRTEIPHAHIVGFAEEHLANYGVQLNNAHRDKGKKDIVRTVQIHTFLLPFPFFIPSAAGITTAVHSPYA